MAKIHPAMARGAARLIAGAGPSMTHARARAYVEHLRSQAERAPEIIANVTGLDEACERVARVPVRVVDREKWTIAASRTAEIVLESTSALQSTTTAAEVALALASVSAHVLGQFDPFYDDGATRPSEGAVEPGRLLLVAPNIVAYRRKYLLDKRDLALWAGIHEMTHGVQFKSAPWIAEYLTTRAKKVMDPENSYAGVFSEGPGAEMIAFLSMLEGHSEIVMRGVPLALMPSRDRLIASMSLRRINPINSVIGKVMKMNITKYQYQDGTAFVRDVVSQVGHRGLNAVWASPLNVPTPEEISHPAAWVDRVLS